MELKTLLLGLIMATASFAVKTGLGWGYALSASRGWTKATASTAVVAGYALFFAVIYLFVQRVDILANYASFAPLWENGTLLHWLMAFFLAIWAVVLLRGAGCVADNCSRPSPGKSWLALVIPCPVCLSVVVMAESALALYFPDRAAMAVAILFAAFMAVAGVSACCMLLGSGSDENRRDALGMAMLFIALYFALFALVSPQIGDAERIYAIASRRPSTPGPISSPGTVLAIGALLVIGFIVSLVKNRRVQ
ncbi:MAG: DUF2162 domain-containing protein [Planctomycetaceae bacterium]|nr:DUF2162 domain-containing protein [Planctomycetaceae bacterium]